MQSDKNEKSERFIQKMQDAIENDSVSAFYDELLANLDQYLIPIGHESTQKEYLLPPFLTECQCARFDRLKSDRRKRHEDQIIQFSAQYDDYKKNGVFNYLSLGPGGLLQDFILLCRMIKEANIKNFKLVFIEPYNLNEMNIEQLKLMLLNISNDIKLEVEHFKYFDDYIKTGKAIKFDVINAADFDDFPILISDVMGAQLGLNTHGRLFVSVDQYDFQFDLSRCISYQSHEKFTAQDEQFKKDILTLPKATATQDIFYCGVSRIDLIEFLEIILPAVQELGYKKFQLTAPKDKSQFGVCVFLKLLFPSIAMNYDAVNFENYDSKRYGVSPIQPIIDHNAKERIPYHLIFWSTNQSTVFNLQKECNMLKPLASDTTYQNTMIVVAKPSYLGSVHFRFHAQNGYQIYFAADQEVEAFIKKMYGSLYQYKSHELTEKSKKTIEESSKVMFWNPPENYSEKQVSDKQADMQFKLTQ